MFDEIWFEFFCFCEWVGILVEVFVLIMGYFLVIFY